jgi:hypothetical protein
VVEINEEEFRAASKRGRIARETQPHAKAAQYDAKAGRVDVELTKVLPPLCGGAREWGQEELLGRWDNKTPISFGESSIFLNSQAV